jgi:hypothetical protein
MELAAVGGAQMVVGCKELNASGAASMNDAQNEIERWREEADHWRKEAERLQKALGDRQQAVPVANTPPSLIDNLEFIVDLARFSEGLCSEQAVRKKYHFNEETWERLGTDDELVERVEAEKVRRVRDGSFKREKAQQLVTKAPEVLDGIMMDTKANAKHKVDAIKTLDALAANGPGAAPEQDRFIIRIDLTAGGGEVLEFNRPLKPDPNDSDVIDATPGLPGFMIAAKKDDGGGQPL